MCWSFSPGGDGSPKQGRVELEARGARSPRAGTATTPSSPWSTRRRWTRPPGAWEAPPVPGAEAGWRSWTSAISNRGPVVVTPPLLLSGTGAGRGAESPTGEKGKCSDLAGCGNTGSAEGRSPFAGSLRVSLRYKSPLPFLDRKGSEGWLGRILQQPAPSCPRRRASTGAWGAFLSPTLNSY